MWSHAEQILARGWERSAPLTLIPETTEQHPIKRVGIGLPGVQESSHTSLLISTTAWRHLDHGEHRGGSWSSWEHQWEVMEEQVARWPSQALPDAPASAKVSGGLMSVLQCHGGASLCQPPQRQKQPASLPLKAGNKEGHSRCHFSGSCSNYFTWWSV